MIDLGHGQGAIFLDPPGHLGQAWNVFVFRDAHTEGAVLGSPFHEHGFQYDYAGPTLGPLRVIVTVVVRCKAIAMGKVCVHGRHYNAVACGEPADVDRLEKAV